MEENPMEYAYQRLDIWKKAVDLSIKVIQCIAEVADELESQRLAEEIEMSAVNIATNIAKGKACLSEEDFIYHLFLSKRSLYETMTLLEILKAKHLITDECYKEIEIKGKNITTMLIEFIRSVKDTGSPYQAENYQAAVK
jgi:four helix bundle protein